MFAVFVPPEAFVVLATLTTFVILEISATLMDFVTSAEPPAYAIQEI